jgi:hypothetical protein
MGLTMCQSYLRNFSGRLTRPKFAFKQYIKSAAVLLSLPNSFWRRIFLRPKSDYPGKRTVILQQEQKASAPMQLDEHELVSKLDAHEIYDSMIARYGAPLTPAVEAISRLVREGPARDTGYPGIIWVATRQSFTHNDEDRCPDFPEVHLVAVAAEINSTLASSAKLLSKGTREQRELSLI